MEKETKPIYKDCLECGSYNKKGTKCDCKNLEDNLKILLKECRSFSLKDKQFKEAKQGQEGRSISRAFHIPYSGMGDPDYVQIYNFMQDSVYSIILECFENSEDVESISDLKTEFENYDDNGSIHQYVESDLTWQQSLRESDIILNEFSEYEQDDSGLWEGQEPEEAIRSKAFWTYKSALEGEVFKKIEEFE